jgi:hypothetical protein
VLCPTEIHSHPTTSSGKDEAEPSQQDTSGSTPRACSKILHYFSLLFEPDVSPKPHVLKTRLPADVLLGCDWT